MKFPLAEIIHDGAEVNIHDGAEVKIHDGSESKIHDGSESNIAYHPARTDSPWSRLAALTIRRRIPSRYRSKLQQ